MLLSLGCTYRTPFGTTISNCSAIVRGSNMSNLLEGIAHRPVIVRPVSVIGDESDEEV